MLFLVPGDVNAVHWVTAPSPADFTAPVPPSGAEFGRLQLQPNSSTSYDTVYFDLSQAAWPPTPGSTFVRTTYPTSRPLAFRHVYKSITAHLIAPAVANQGTVYAAQFPPNFSSTTALMSTGERDGTVAGNPSVAVIPRMIRIPMSEAALTLMSPDPFVGPARDGIYMPLHMAGPTQPYTTPIAPTYFETGVGTSAPAGLPAYFGPLVSVGGIPASTATFPQGPVLVEGGRTAWPFLAAFPGLTSPLPPPPSNVWTGWDSGFDNTNVGVIIFRGLAGTTASSFGATVQIKAMVGLEIIPRPEAPNRVYAREAAAFDPLAMRVYYQVLRELRQAYPASYNAFGFLGPLIMRMMSTIVPHLPAAVTAATELYRTLKAPPPPVRADIKAPAKPQPKTTRPARKKRA
jgi:hypothetical protein